MYKIFDNFLDYDTFNQIKSVFVGNYSFPWYYNEKILSTEDKLVLDKFQFTHILYKQNQGICSDFYQFLIPLIDKIDTPLLIKIKANLGTRTNSHIESGMHTDSDLIHKTAVFYLNTNNGYTLFEDGGKVESLENRLVVFNSNIAHTGVSQTDTNIRCLINLNYF